MARVSAPAGEQRLKNALRNLCANYAGSAFFFHRADKSPSKVGAASAIRTLGLHELRAPLLDGAGLARRQRCELGQQRVELNQTPATALALHFAILPANDDDGGAACSLWLAEGVVCSAASVPSSNGVCAASVS